MLINNLQLSVQQKERGYMIVAIKMAHDVQKKELRLNFLFCIYHMKILKSSVLLNLIMNLHN
jgi:hypothetical protein